MILTHKEIWDGFYKAQELKTKRELEEKSIVESKRIKSGLRKCKGHKSHKFPVYDKNNRCSICGGVKD